MPKTKREFYAKWRSMQLGNRIQQWPDKASLLNSGYSGLVSVRSLEIGGQCTYSISVEAALQLLGTYNESPDDSKLLLQGELLHDLTRGYYLYYSRVKRPMREALRTSAIDVHNLLALGILRSVCYPNSFDMLMELLDLYPDAVVEFGVYSYALGILPHHNTVIWEVREY